jgi:phage regulator Rha-like protein
MSTLDILNQDGTLVVSSETIADGSGVQHKNVLDLIDSRRPDFEDFGPLAFETRKGVALAQGGFAKGTRFALLNEAQATLLMTFQRNTDQVVAFKKALVKAFFDMARQLMSPQVPQSLPDALRAYAAEVEQRQALEAKVVSDAPKVAHAETFRAAAGARTVGDVANDFKAHASERFPHVKVLHQDVWDHAHRLGLVIRGDSVRRNQPTAQAIDAGWARPSRATFGTRSHGLQTKVTTHLTPRGEARLWDGLCAWLGEHGTLSIARAVA